MRRLAHAHEDDAFDRPQAARQCHLGDDLGAADLADQAVAAGHAEHAADRAADLGGDAQAAFGQQHGLGGLAVVQAQQQADRAVVGRVLRAQLHQAAQLGQQPVPECTQRFAQAVLGRARAAWRGQRLRPLAQQALRLPGVGARRVQTGDDVGDLHGRFKQSCRRR